jgi:DNA-binding transcriptional ArsR family regulator
MIGVIGSRDSVELAIKVAAELGMADEVVGRSYREIHEATALARQLEPACSVLLFTGYVPYLLAQADTGTEFGALLEFVPHPGIDLYRALAVVLRDHGGRLPPVSLDTISEEVAEETYRDLGLPPPRHILPRGVYTAELAATPAGAVAAFHVERYERGDVQVCLTCLGHVAVELQARGIPVVRIEHTRSTLRDALTRAALAARVARIEDAQIAVAVVRLRNAPEGREPGPVRTAIASLAERLHGVLTHSGAGTFLVHTTRGAIERHLAVSEWRRDQLAAEVGLPADVGMGFGVGSTAAEAEGNARWAMKLGGRSDHVYLTLADGTIRGGDSGEGGSRRHPGGLRRPVTGTGLPPAMLARLAAASRQLDAGAFTARELADAYGVEARSARRILAALREAGIAAVSGSKAIGAGRPETLYLIDVDRLLSVG